MGLKTIERLIVTLVALGLGTCAAPCDARTTLKDICRVKGQEENTLQGLGFVVGLNGTGDGSNFQATLRSLAKAMTVMGEPPGANGLAELKDAKNVALVTVTATIPASGARQGDKIGCVVSSIGSAKDLTGGRLFLTPLIGPDRNDPRVYAFAEGAISLDDPKLMTTGRIHAGCQLEAEFFHVFTKDGKITLVLDNNLADFEVAQDLAELINAQLGFQTSRQTTTEPLAKALNQANIIVTIPAQYRDDPVLFVSQVLRLPIPEPRTVARVVINERAGSIVIGGEVEIGAVVVSHKNVVIETGAAAAAERFVPIDPQETSSPKLKALVEALNAVQVPTEDIIDIIKGLDRDGKLHGQLIVE